MERKTKNIIGVIVGKQGKYRYTSEHLISTSDEVGSMYVSPVVLY